MRLVTFRRGASDDARAGVLRDDRIVDLTVLAGRLQGSLPAPLAAGATASVKALLQAGPAALDAVRALVDGIDPTAAQGDDAVLPLDAATLLPPIPDAGTFLCVGKNYRAHLDELVRNDLLKELPQEPTGFIKLNACLSGHEARVERPEGITTLDYEPELVFVIGRPTHRVRKEDALDHVVGITLLNDLTAREVQKREVASGTRFWTAKNMPGFGPLGPSLITLDEVADPFDLWLTCSVNGQERIRVNTRNQIFKIQEIIEHFSRYIPFEPGDMFATGSPGGVAVGQPNAAELFLKPGDVVDVAIDGLLSLRTHITAPEAP